jgi:hypothetical protein
LRTFGVQARRARLARRHLLAPGTAAADPRQVADALVALHGTDPASVFLSVLARMRVPDVAAIERALYDDRVLVRMLGMRRTVFTVPVGTAPVVQAACTRDIAARERRLLLRHLADSDVGDAAWLREVEESTLVALGARGEATAAELATAEPRLRERVMLAQGKPYGGPQNISTRVLFLLAADGRIMRGRPRGSWISSQYRWSRTESWLPGGMPDLPAERARVELARRWLRAFGPGTFADLKWWTGWTAGRTREALAEIGPAEVDLGGGATGLLPAGDHDDDHGDGETARAAAHESGQAGRSDGADAAPRAVLLPALDPTVMGWRERGWFLGDHAPALFDRTGNAGPTIWWEGRVVGGWSQRRSGEIAYRLLEDVGADAVAAVETEAARIGAWLGDVRFSPGFLPPFQRSLAES